MTELSVTVTVGIPSETHNHDLDYRETLEHVHKCDTPIIELIPYQDYREKINWIMRPYIDTYNAKIDARYQAAWDRYNSGEIKTKPRKRDFKKMGYDYYSEHCEDVYYNRITQQKEHLPMFRGIIIGIGDKNDRNGGRITEEQARRILGEIVVKFKEDFPLFVLLGASIHLDESGFYHAHFDYKPMYKNDIGQGLGVGMSQEKALELMGYEPEQSIINSYDKAPLRFNAMRNRIYHRMEEAMAMEKLRLQYGASKIKEPEKDSSKNQRLKNWQDTQDAVRSIQHQKNLVLDTLDMDFVTDDEIKDTVEITNSLLCKLQELEDSPRSRIDKRKVVVEFRLLDQLKSFVKSLISFIVHLYKERNDYRDKYNELLAKKTSIDAQVKSADFRRQEQESGAARSPDHNKGKGKDQ